MKKIISTLLVCVLLLGCVMTLASCGKKLSGKYAINDSLYYEFDGNKYEGTIEIFGLSKTVKGTYEIKENNEGNLEIIFTEEGGEPDAMSFAEGEEDGVKYIKIGGVKYTKVDKK